MFFQHRQFSFCSVNSKTITSYRQEERVLRNKLPREALCNGDFYTSFDDTVVFKIYRSYKSDTGFNNKTHQSFLARYYRNLAVIDHAPKYTKIYIFRKIIRNAIKSFVSMTKWWLILFNDHYTAAIEMLKELDSEKCCEITRKVIDKFIEMSDKFLLKNLNIVFMFPLEYFRIFVQKYPAEMTYYAMKRSKNTWVSKELASIVCEKRDQIIHMRTKVFSYIFKLPVEICELINLYCYEELYGETFLNYFNNSYDYKTKEVQSPSIISVNRYKIPNHELNHALPDKFIDTFYIQLN